MKSLIIGGAGFVGPYLEEALHKSNPGMEVYVSKLAHESYDHPGAKVIDLDILDKDMVAGTLEKIRPDWIFHLAAQSSVGLSWKNPKLTVDININGTLNILEALKGLDYKPRVLLIGSGEEYGHIKPNEVPINEDNNTRPGNIYAATKACSNMLGKIYSDAYDLDIISVRAFNHIGPNQKPLFVVADFCHQAVKIEKGLQDPTINVGNLSAKRDFTDVRDVVRAYVMLMDRAHKGQTYNVGSGKAIMVDEILQTILKHAKAKIDVNIDKSKFRPVDVPIIEADISKLQKTIDWQPEIELDSTIQETLDYFRKTVE
ncbi:MAG: GDP-mannose 4,6-dehydratase [Erysipelotrichaceae bacterium]|nr:GDP-mannose 4,6-dehydratase [Erysipelotrichaceae bacterium]MDD3810438.1 GDP-mannose 4,6-dehydratase [Erysipelotrichaceae bacterium]